MDVPSSNKGWHGDFLMSRGADLGYLPEYRNPDEITGGIRRSEKLEVSERDMARDFAGGQVKGYGQIVILEIQSFYMITTVRNFTLGFGDDCFPLHCIIIIFDIC